MIRKNSGKIYRFKLQHNLGYGFAEVYDFTDYSMFSGRLVYVFDRIEKEEKSKYKLAEIRSSNIAIGPLHLGRFPNVRGVNSWKFLFQAKDLLIKDLPVTKSLHGLTWDDDNWANFKKQWYTSNFNPKKELPTYVDYEDVRHLETRILHFPLDVVIKSTMKALIDSNQKVSDYYDLSDLAYKFRFVELINTYYPLAKTRILLKQLPVKFN